MMTNLEANPVERDAKAFFETWASMAKAYEARETSPLSSAAQSQERPSGSGPPAGTGQNHSFGERRRNQKPVEH